MNLLEAKNILRSRDFSSSVSKGYRKKSLYCSHMKRTLISLDARIPNLVDKYFLYAKTDSILVFQQIICLEWTQFEV